MKKFIGLILCLLSLNTFAFSDEFQVMGSINTDFGIFQVLNKVKPECCSAPKYLALNGNIFYQESDELYLSFMGAYKIKGGIAILLSKSCGGSGCRVNSLSFISYKKDKGPIIITDDNFFSDSLTIDASEHLDGVEVDLGYENQKQKKAIFANDKLAITYTESDIKTLSEENCRDLYDASKSCARLYQKGLDCNQYTKDSLPGSNEDMWVEHKIKNYPGFNREGLNQECLHACMTGTLSEYNIYKEHSCTKSH